MFIYNRDELQCARIHKETFITYVYNVLVLYKGERFLLDLFNMDTTGKLGRGDK